MSNSIATKTNAIMVAGSIKAEAPILQFVNKELSDEFKPGSGATVDALVASYGTVTSGEAIGDGDVDIESIPVAVTIANTNANLGIVEKALSIENYDESVAKPRGARLASYVNTAVFDSALYAAEYAEVSTGTFSQLAMAISDVEGSRVSGKMSGMLNTRLKAIITGSGINQFGNSSLAEDLYKGMIGEFNGAEFFSSSDAKNIMTDWVPTSGTTVGTSISTNGTESIVLSDSSLTSADVLKAGTVIKIAGQYALDAFGESTGILRAFVCTTDTTASAGSVTMPVAPLYFSGAKANVYATITSGSVVTTPMESDSIYYPGVVFNGNAITFASAAIQPFAGADSTTTKIAGEINVRMSAQSNVSTGRQIVRWDILFGVKAIYGKAIALVLVKES